MSVGSLIRSLRGLLRPGNRGYALAASLSLAAGIAGVLAVSALLHALLIAPLPVQDEARVLRLADRHAATGVHDFASAYLQFRALQQARSFEAIAALRMQSVTVRDVGPAEQWPALAASPELWQVLGLKPLLGRPLDEADTANGDALLIAETFWRQRYAASPSVLGEVLKVDGREHRIVGVAPDALGVVHGHGLWLPLTDDGSFEGRGDRRLTVIGRLAEGVDSLAASAELDALNARLQAEFPDSNAGWDTELRPLRDWLLGSATRERVLWLTGAVALLLLITCANVAGLQLTRAAQRRRVQAVQNALGARPGRLAGEALIDTLAVTLVGACLGLVGGRVLLELAVTQLQAGLPQLAGAELSTGLAALTICLCIAVALVFGLLPARAAARIDHAALSGRGSASPARSRTRRRLVAAQCLLATVLLSGALGLVQHLHGLQQAPLGFVSDAVLTASLNLPSPRSAEELAAANRTLQRLQQGLLEIAGVQAVGIASGAPMASTDTQMRIGPGPAPLDHAAAERQIQGSWRIVDTAYFEALDIPLRAGRLFTPDESYDSILLSERVARHVYPEGDALGQIVTMGNDQRRTVVGIVGDTRQRDPGEASTPTIYMPTTWFLWSPMQIVIRTQHLDDARVQAIRTRAAELLPEHPLYDLHPLRARIAATTATPRVQTWLLSGFAMVALLIAAIGIGSVVALGVAQRRSELALRLALGASPRSLLRGVLGEGLALALPGVAAGALLAALALLAMNPSASARAFGFGSPMLAAAVLLGICLIACLLPALHAARTPPQEALREV